MAKTVVLNLKGEKVKDLTLKSNINLGFKTIIPDIVLGIGLNAALGISIIFSELKNVLVIKLK